MEHGGIQLGFELRGAKNIFVWKFLDIGMLILKVASLVLVLK